MASHLQKNHAVIFCGCLRGTARGGQPGGDHSVAMGNREVVVRVTWGCKLSQAKGRYSSDELR